MPINIIATAHGTDSTEGRDTIDSMIKCLQLKLANRLGPLLHIYEAYVDVQIPELGEVLEALPSDDQTIILPLLLSTGYHMQVDMKEAAKNSGIENISIADSLGPSYHLAQLMHHRLIEKGWRPGDRVVMAAAGSSRGEGQDAVARQCTMLSNELAQDITFGFVADIEPRIGQVLEQAVAEKTDENENIFVATYLLGRGVFDTKLSHLAATHGAISADPLMIPGDESACDTIIACALDNLDRID